VAKRSPAQKIGARGHKWLAARIEEHPHWLSRDLTEDYGVDLEAELTEHGVRGEILKVQIKSVAQAKHKAGNVKFVIGRRYVELASVSRYPMVLVLVELEGNQAWYLWLQDWLLKNRMSVMLASRQSSWVHWVPARQTIGEGLDSELIASQARARARRPPFATTSPDSPARGSASRGC
jgi:uncharacterized protein DUF4365